MRRAFLTLAVLAVAAVGWGQVFKGYPAQAVGDTSVTVDLRANLRSVSIVNTGDNTIYGQAYYVGQTPVAAVAADPSSPMVLEPGENYDFMSGEKFEEKPIRYIVLICAAGKSSTAKILAKP